MRASERLKKIMKHKRITTVKLAEILGNSKQTLYNTFNSDIRSKGNGMTYENVVRIADALGCDVVIRDRETGEEY